MLGSHYIYTTLLRHGGSKKTKLCSLVCVVHYVFKDATLKLGWRTGAIIPELEVLY
jgi:hypothetical protein